MDLRSLVVKGRLRVRAKPNARETKLLGTDATGTVALIAVAAAPEDNKANIALLKFVKKQLGRPVALKSGAASRDKVLEVR